MFKTGHDHILYNMLQLVGKIFISVLLLSFKVQSRSELLTSCIKVNNTSGESKGLHKSRVQTIMVGKTPFLGLLGF